MEPQHIFSDRHSLTTGLAPEEIRKKLAACRPQVHGDHMQDASLLPPQPYRDASVLIPLMNHDNGCTVLFTKRTSHLHVHAGQVSFPGGRADDMDKNAIATALREAEEEIGLTPSNVSILGTLGHYITRTSFKVTPVVGLIEPPQQWRPDSFEVAEIFEVPLTYILSPGTLSLQKNLLDGNERHYYALTWQDFHIWGATAGMLKNFVDVIRNE